MALSSAWSRPRVPKGWKWTIHLPGRRPKTGFSPHRAIAIAAAKVAIESAIKTGLHRHLPSSNALNLKFLVSGTHLRFIYPLSPPRTRQLSVTKSYPGSRPLI